MREPKKRNTQIRRVIALLTLALILPAFAIEIPKASAKALNATKGRVIRTGLVFVNGKFLPPPYYVERWGVGLRINGQPVVSQVIDWTEFLKTQSGVKVTKSETPAAPEPAAAPAAPEPAPEPVAVPTSSDDDSEDSLDDLFDDDPKPKKDKKPAKKAFTWKPKPIVKKPTTTVSYSLEGDFEPNDASRKLVSRINDVRTSIDKSLRSGGFICFGDNYSRISGDSRTAMKFLEKIPELQRRCDSPESFTSAVRAAGFVFLTDDVCADLYRNKVDYVKLQQRLQTIKNDQALEQLLK